MKQEIKLSDHFNYTRLIRFTMPTILMMVFTSIYGVVDGFFVSNFVGKTSFAAINFIMPFLMIVGTFGFMFGTGGSALIAKTLGEGKREKAQEIFSFIVYATFISGVVVAIFSIAFIRPIMVALGAEGKMLEDCVVYGRIILLALPFLMLQYAFSSLVVAAEKPKLGLMVTVIAGVINMAGDALLMVVIKWGIVGAAVATTVGQIAGGLIPLIYFARKNTSRLRLGKTRWDGWAFARICMNGSSELMSNISMSVVSMLYNAQLMKYAGEDGIAAYGTLMYVNFIFISIFIGYVTGMAPVVSFHYGAGNKGELKGLLKKSTLIVIISSCAMFVISEFMAGPLAKIFVSYDKELLTMTVHAFRIYAFSFFFAGLAIFGSAFFTALNDGLTSALISFLRTLVFQCAAVMIMPLIWGLDGIWLSIVVAEVMAVMVTLFFLILKRKKYGYI